MQNSVLSQYTVLLSPTSLLPPEFPFLVTGISVSSASPHLRFLEAIVGSHFQHHPHIQPEFWGTTETSFLSLCL